MKYKIFVLLIAVAVLVPTILYAAMIGGNFELYADSFSIIDEQASTGGGYSLFGSGEAFETGSSTDGTFELRGGFQAQERGILIYSASSNTVTLGLLATSTVATDSIDISISTDSETGYALAISEDGNLRDGANDIDDVVDGTVTAGTEEYGIVTSGSDGLLVAATAINGTVAVASTLGLVSNSSTNIEFQAAISDVTANGSYSHVVTFTATVNP